MFSSSVGMKARTSRIVPLRPPSVSSPGTTSCVNTSGTPNSNAPSSVTPTDKTWTDTDSLPSPDVLATEITDDLEAALEQFSKIAARLTKIKVPGRLSTE